MSATATQDVTGRDDLADAVDGRASELDLGALRARIRDEGLAVPRPWHNLAHMALQVGLYLGLAAVGFAFDRWWVWAVVTVAMGFVLLGPGGIMHETVHGHLFRSRWGNKAAGTLSGMVLLFPWGTYRAYHVEHHASTATRDDPEGVPVAFGSRLELCLLPLGGVYTIGQLWWYTIRTLVGRPPRWVRTAGQRRDIRVSVVVVLAFIALVVVGFVVVPSVVLHLWVLPALVAVFVSYPLIFLPEHSYGAPGDTLDHTRTTESNRLLGWIYWNNNFHAVHHLIPTTVHQHVPELSRSIRDHQRGDWWSTGFLSYLWSVARRLPTLPRRRRDDVIDLRD